MYFTSSSLEKQSKTLRCHSEKLPTTQVKRGLSIIDMPEYLPFGKWLVGMGPGLDFTFILMGERDMLCMYKTLNSIH